MKVILGGHWTDAPKGWVALTEDEQDITKRFQWDDSSLEAVATEHVFEHCDFFGGINYMKESYRCLKPGGILRTVAPFVDKLVQFDSLTFRGVGGQSLNRSYIINSLKPYYPGHAEELESMGIDFLSEGLPFFLDSLMKKHNHKFLWSTTLMLKVLSSIGFSDVRICLPGESEFDESTCLERRYRGVDHEIAQAFGYSMFDPESLVVEAKK